MITIVEGTCPPGDPIGSTVLALRTRRLEMPRDRPQIIVVKHEGHGCIIGLLLLIIAWPLAIAYWILLLLWWLIRTSIDWLTLGPLRRRL